MSHVRMMEQSRLTRVGVREALPINFCLLLFLVLSCVPIYAGETAGLPADFELTPVTPERLGGTERTLSFLATDKPIYKPGEKVYARATVLMAENNFPVEQANLYAQFTVTGPKDEQLAQLVALVADSVAGFAWQIPAGTPGGRYRATVTTAGNAPATRTFEIRVYNPPRLKSQIEFLREGYGPGDTATAVANIIRAEGGVPEGAKVTAVARIDDREVARIEGLTVDAQGNCRASFTLPADMERGEGTLAFLVEDGGVVETASKTIPILLQTLDIVFYPESGDLVAGLPCRVYVQAKKPDGKPADLQGEIIAVDDAGMDKSGGSVAVLATVHEGRGILPAFAPRLGEKYALRIHQPSGIKKLFPLPEVRGSGAVLRADKETYGFDEPISLGIWSTPDSGAAAVSLYHREKRVALAPIKPGETSVRLSPEDCEGILIATVWDRSGQPLAERLVFRKPLYAVHVEMRTETDPEGGSPTPGGKVRLKVATRDENGKPVGAVVGISVSDDALLEMVEKRDQAPSLPVMVYLENEVGELADAHVYFDSANPDADRDVDLLLGCQGWRRFILVKLEDILSSYPEAAKRALAILTPPEQLAGFEIPFREGEPMPPSPPGMHFVLIQKPAVYDTVTETVTVRAPATFQVPVPGEYATKIITLGSGSDVSDIIDPSSAAQEPPPAAQIGDSSSAAAPGETAPSLELPAGINTPQVPSQPAEPESTIAAASETPSSRPPEAPPTYANQNIPEKKETITRKVLRAPANLVWRLRNDDDDPYAPPMVKSVDSLVAVREYAHAIRPNRRPNDRVDFTETVYWNAGVRTNPRSGTATMTFDLSDSVTTFRVRADAFGVNGALGSGTLEIASVEPFHLEPKTPPVAVMGDRITIPVALVNATASELDWIGMSVNIEGLAFAAPQMPATLAANSRDRALVDVAADKAGQYSLVLSAIAGFHADSVTYPLTVLPRGFPIQNTASGLVDKDRPFTAEIAIPPEIVPGSMKVSAKIYPTPLANMEESLSALIRKPYGCFEQTSSVNYPLVLAQQYFTTHADVSPDKIRQAAEMLEMGYNRIQGFECKSGGFEWYGGDPGHEALTAYGLMQFKEMRTVMPIDDAIIARARTWLFSRRDGKGGFLRSDKRGPTFGYAPEPITNIYILWGLLESGEKTDILGAEIAAARKMAAETKDPYEQALCANILYLIGDLPAARKLAAKVLDSQTGLGGVMGAKTSITRSGGDSLNIETTSLAIIAWLRCGEEFSAATERAVSWLFKQCKAGSFGATQSTILALKAINLYDAARSQNPAPGTAQLVIDGRPFGAPVAFGKKDHSALEFPDFAPALTAGSHTIEVIMAEGWKMPVALEIVYNTPKPVDSPECPLVLQTSLSATEVPEGEPVDLKVMVSAKDENVAMPLAVIGLPAGLEPRHERLKELIAAGQIASYEIIGRELVLYWRSLQAKERMELSIPLIAWIPGTYTAPASRAYAFYTDEYMHWVSGEKIIITPK